MYIYLNKMYKYSIDLNCQYLRLIIPLNNLGIFLVRIVITILTITSAALLPEGLYQCSSITISSDNYIKLCGYALTISTWKVFLATTTAILALYRLTSGANFTKHQCILSIFGFVCSFVCTCIEAHYHHEGGHRYMEFIHNELASQGYKVEPKLIQHIHAIPAWTATMAMCSINTMLYAVDAVMTWKLTDDHLLGPELTKRESDLMNAAC